MSWSVMYLGKPANIQAALESYGESLTGQSRDEFVAALPHLSGILSLNSDRFGLKLHANGSTGSCNVSIEYLQSTLV